MSPPCTSLAAALDLLQHASAGVRRRIFCAGDLLFQQEEPANWLYYIQSGYVRIFLSAADGRERTIRLLGPGDFAGDDAFYLDKAHHSFAQAFEGPVVTYQISHLAFEELLREQPELYQVLLARLAETTLILTDIIEDQTFKDLRERVQITLLYTAGHYGTVGPDGVTINIHLTHEMIASMAGATRTRVSMCMSELQRAGFYHIANQRIVLSSWAAGLVLPP